MTRLRLLCHASTDAVRSSFFPADEPLDEHARTTLARCPHGLAHADRYLTSPALRARQTADALGLTATVDPLLRDCDYGRWAGRSLDDVLAGEPVAFSEWRRDAASAPHGGESLCRLIARAGAWLDGVAEAPGQVVAVTHAAFIRAVIVHAIDALPRSFWRIDVAPLSLTKLSSGKGHWTVASIGVMRTDGA